MNHSQSYERFQRQMRLPGLGHEGQEKLSSARVLVIGAGGLGCPVLQYLAAAGIGHIGIADPDIVSLSNLHRQVLFGMDDLGTLKVDAAAKALRRIQPDISLQTFPETWTNRTGESVLEQYDVVVDASDNFATKYLLNDACMIWKKPLVFGAVSRFQGQVAVFDGRLSNPIHYRDFFSTPPAPEEVMDCAAAGVIGMLTGIIGNMQALEVVKIITGLGQTLTGRLLTYDGLRQETYMAAGRKNQQGSMDFPQTKAAFLQWDYRQEEICRPADVAEITPEQLHDLMESGPILLIDVRQLDEEPRLDIEHLALPMPLFKDQDGVWEGKDLVFICQHGQRSLQAARLFKERKGDGKVYSLKGGVEKLRSDQNRKWI